ncbi:uncharacterized protein LOC134657706 [Cydia amplana]|uniref:uncharacterized protein LOC134657706 n=1 Tax=Cydia amplana TaxID=1869771 RepID=UPI002FE552B4
MLTHGIEAGRDLPPRGGSLVGYKIQYIVSSISQIIVAEEVTERVIWPDSDDVILEYADETTKPKRNRNESVKANRSTSTLTKTVADVSTITSDWWSPLFERKPMRRKTDMAIDNNWHENRYKGPAAKWGPLLYHHDLGGALSASNYLLQKYSVSEKPSFKMYRHLRNG